MNPKAVCFDAGFFVDCVKILTLPEHIHWLQAEPPCFLLFYKMDCCCGYHQQHLLLKEIQTFFNFRKNLYSFYTGTNIAYNFSV